MQFAGVIIDITHEKLNKIFTYIIPEHLQQVLRVGMEVKVPFGRANKLTSAYVIEIKEQCGMDPEQLKEIREVVPGRTAIESRLIELAGWMAGTYGSTMIQALKTVLPAKNEIQAVRKRRLVLKASVSEGEAALEELVRKNQKARVRLLKEILEHKELPYEVVTSKLHVTKPVIDALVQKDLILVEEESAYRDPIRQLKAQDPPIERPLSPEQEAALSAITEDRKAGLSKTYLLHGVTGSGKTEVYIRAIRNAIKDGGQAIVLIPEIALTYQTVMRFHAWFGDRVSIMNSRLSQGERYDQFLRAKRGEIDVVIGPRSALFMPMPDLKLIVIDEEHETSYKSEQSPRYHAVGTAIHLARMTGASVILGSATPSMESYHNAVCGNYTLLKLNSRIAGRAMARTRVVDLCEELKAGNRSIISGELDQAIRDRLEKREQIMLFLNRRGYSGFLSCRECGHVITCEHCDVSMSVHRGDRLICHYCGAEKPVPKVCPKCGSRHISGFKAGTQQVEDLLKATYPEARVLRMDMDTTRDKDGHTRILSQFSEHQADILVGTQMIVKGHDFPDVTLVGILAADLSLYAGDFRAPERTFQLLCQAAGRAGRGTKEGEVIIQTYTPEHYAIRLAAEQNYRAYYEEELDRRELMDYPPAGHILTVHLSGTDKEKLDLAADFLRKYAEIPCEKLEVLPIGPADPVIPRVKDVYRKVLFFKHENYDILIRLRNYLNSYIEINSGYKDIRIQYDYDG